MPDFSRIFGIIKDLLLPTSCPVCTKETERSGICAGCLSVLENAMLSDGSHELDAGVYSIKCRAVFSYEYEQVKSLVLYMKKNPDMAVCMYCASFLAREVRAFGLTGDTVITYVPRSGEGLREYGFDQSQMLARCLARLVPEAVFGRLVKRHGRSRQQKRLSAKDRKENVKGKFRAVKTDASPKNIVITDDMFTTGSSVKECAEVLKAAFPAADIYCVTVAKNPAAVTRSGLPKG